MSMPGGRTKHFKSKVEVIKINAIAKMHIWLSEHTDISENCLHNIAQNYRDIPAEVYAGAYCPRLYICQKKRWIIYETREKKLYCVDYDGQEHAEWCTVKKRFEITGIRLRVILGRLAFEGRKSTFARVVEHFKRLHETEDTLTAHQNAPKLKVQQPGTTSKVRQYVRI
jgi:hypothetical protein